MITVRRLLAPTLALGIVIVTACGGTVAGGGDGGTCPATVNSVNAACSSGQRCTSTYPNCPGDPPGTMWCDCVDGHFSCPQPGAPRCPDNPPIEPCGFAGIVSNGESCTGAKGVSCGSLACPNVPSVQCTCDGATFHCGKCPADAGADADATDPGPVDAGPG